MKTFILFLLMSFLSLVLMTVIDYRIGSKAEFLNAYSVLQRLLGNIPSVEDSMAARKFGAIGELVIVLIVNLGVVAILTAMIRFVWRHQ